MLRRLADGLWVKDHPLRIGGLDLGTRATLMRGANAALTLVSPVPFSPEDRAAIDDFGAVTAIVAPTLVHHLFLDEAAAHWPKARVLVCPGLAPKLSKLKRVTRVDGTVETDELPASGGAVRTQFIAGMPGVNEVALLHEPSRTLVLTDLCFNSTAARGWFTRLFMSFNAAPGGFGPTRVVRSYIRDRKGLRESVDALLQWDFDRVVVAHGEVLETGGKAAFEKAWAWL